MAPMAKGNVEAAGYVVQKTNGLGGSRFLSRSGRFIRHSDRGTTPGICRAWVHSEEFLLKGGDWDKRLGLVVSPARFNPKTGMTQLTGPAVSLDYFQNSGGGRIGLDFK